MFFPFTFMYADRLEWGAHYVQIIFDKNQIAHSIRFMRVNFLTRNVSKKLVHLLDFVVLVNHSILKEALRREGPCKSGHISDFHGSLENLTISCLFLESRIFENGAYSTGFFPFTQIL
jgi:hypothetical protein